MLIGSRHLTSIKFFLCNNLAVTREAGIRYIGVPESVMQEKNGRKVSERKRQGKILAVLAFSHLGLELQDVYQCCLVHDRQGKHLFSASLPSLGTK